MKPLIVSFSGGRTSAYMAYILKRDYSQEYNMRFVFMNTGEEREETLIFIDRCDRAYAPQSFLRRRTVVDYASRVGVSSWRIKSDVEHEMRVWHMNCAIF